MIAYPVLPFMVNCSFTGFRKIVISKSESEFNTECVFTVPIGAPNTQLEVFPVNTKLVKVPFTALDVVSYSVVSFVLSDYHHYKPFADKN